MRQRAPHLRAVAEPVVVPPPQSPLDVARRFVDDNYADERARRLVHHRGLFYTWAGTHWVEAEQRAVRGHLWRWLGDAVWMKSGELAPFDPNKAKVANVLEALEAVAHVSDRLEAPAWIDVDATPFPAADVVAMQNGLLRLSTRMLIQHTPAYFNVHVLPFAYEPRAAEPERWLFFLHELWGDDQESIDTLQEIFGYLLAGGTSLQKIFLLVGPKRSGRGTIVRVATALLGKENVAGPTLSSLAAHFGLQPLVGKPLATISDARLGTRRDVSEAVERLLSISGEDTISVPRKHKDDWTGRLPTRFLIVSNEVPKLTDAAGALPSRFIILMFSTSFYGRENPKLTEELLEQAPGIFNWALAGLDRLVARGRFLQPTAAESALRQLERLASPVSAFVRDRCVVGAELAVGKDELWTAWREWCQEEGGSHGTKEVFVRDLRAAFTHVIPSRPTTPDGERVHVLRGLALAAEQTVGKTPDPPDRESSPSGVSGVPSTVEASYEDILGRSAQEPA